MVLRFEKHQYDRLLQQNENKFVDRIMATVREQQPENRLPDEIMRHDIRTGIARAHGHELKSDRLVSEYVLIMFEIAPNFDRQPDIARVLASRTMTPEKRWERLFNTDMDFAWQSADQANFYDQRAWWPEGHDFGDDAPKPKDLKDADWGELSYSLAYLKKNPGAASVPEPPQEQLAEFTRAFRTARTWGRG